MLGHHRTKSNPDPLGTQTHTHNASMAEASKRLIASESMQDLYKRTKNHPSSCDVDSPHESPSGTPPPPYRGLVGKFQFVNFFLFFFLKAPNKKIYFCRRWDWRRCAASVVWGPYTRRITAARKCWSSCEHPHRTKHNIHGGWRYVRPRISEFSETF